MSVLPGLFFVVMIGWFVGYFSLFAFVLFAFSIVFCGIYGIFRFGFLGKCMVDWRGYLCCFPAQNRFVSGVFFRFLRVGLVDCCRARITYYYFVDILYLLVNVLILLGVLIVFYNIRRYFLNVVCHFI